MVKAEDDEDEDEDEGARTAEATELGEERAALQELLGWQQL